MKSFQSVFDIGSLFKCDDACEKFSIDIDLSGFDEHFSDVKFEGQVSNKLGCVTVKGTFSGFFNTNCDRCLDDVSLSLKSEIDTRITENQSKDESLSITDGKIDLIKSAYDALSLEIPIVVHCTENCKGICIGCGVNLNKDICKCK